MTFAKYVTTGRVLTHTPFPNALGENLSHFGKKKNGSAN